MIHKSNYLNLCFLVQIGLFTHFTQTNYYQSFKMFTSFNFGYSSSQSYNFILYYMIMLKKISGPAYRSTRMDDTLWTNEYLQNKETSERVHRWWSGGGSLRCLSQRMYVVSERVNSKKESNRTFCCGEGLLL